MTRAALGLADDFANGIIARQIVELARAGERNPDLLLPSVEDHTLPHYRPALCITAKMAVDVSCGEVS
jgi:hypothetical protein